MERKRTSAFASLWIVLLASFVLVAPMPPASAQPAENHRYVVMPINRKTPGNVMVYDHIGPAAEASPWNFTILPQSVYQNITFSHPYELTTDNWVVDLTVPAETYIGLSYMFYSTDPPFWFRFSASMSDDGYGWIFLNTTGDVDCHTFSNTTATYWHAPSPLAGGKAADHGALPSNGTDGVAGTADDGFGDGAPDPPGSSILVLPTDLTAEYHTGIDWTPLFSIDWPQIFTTGNSTSRVDAFNASLIDGAKQTAVGQRWEFYAGDEHDSVPHDHPKWNAYVTYVCAWAVLDIGTTLGDYDVCFQITEKKVREDLMIADINCDETCNIVDIVIAALGFDKKAQNFGEDGIPYTPDDQHDPDPEYDPRGDISMHGIINIVDIVTIALNFDDSMFPP